MNPAIARTGSLERRCKGCMDLLGRANIGSSDWRVS